jgi:hypothetical protein
MSTNAPKKTQAISLLEGILLETQGEADAEMKRLSEDLKRKEDEARAAAEATERARREEAERRLAEEEARQMAAAGRRAQELERMRIEELKAKGLWKEPEQPKVEEVAPVAAAPVSTRPTMSTVDAVAIQNAQARKSRTAFLVAALAVLGIGGGAGGFVYMNSLEYVDATTTYTKADLAVVEVADAMASLTIQAIPEPIVIAAPTAGEPAGRSNRTRTNRTADTATPEAGRIRLDTSRSVF